jgi:PEP-CTERM motif
MGNIFKFKPLTYALGLALGLSVGITNALAADLYVRAKENSSSGGSGADTFLSLVAGQSFSVSVSPIDLWNAGDLPRWSNANGLTGPNLIYSSLTTDPEVPVYANGTVIGPGSFGTHTQNGHTDAFGTLVGSLDNGTSFFTVGTSFSGNAATSGTLKLFYWDSNNGDNSGSILAHVTSVPVPEPETYAMFMAGLGLIGVFARRAKKAA